MSLNNRWVQIASSAFVGAMLAFATAVAISQARSMTRPAALLAANTSLSSASGNATGPGPVIATQPVLMKRSSDGSQQSAVSQPRSKELSETRLGVDLHEFKHVLVRKTAYMNLPDDPYWLRDFTWKAAGELPAGELVRYEQSLPARGSYCVAQRATGARVILADGFTSLRECWRQNIPTDVQKLVASRNAFSWDLYHQLADKPGNLFFSPSSIAEALTMAFGGARKETATEMSRALKLENGPADVHAGASHLRKLLIQPDRFRGFELDIANRAWLERSYSIEEPYTTMLREHYGAPAGLVDFRTNHEAARREINSWIREQTRGHLPEVLAPGDLDPLTSLVLVNAVYFFGAWDVPFKKQLTKEAAFYVDKKSTRTVSMMKRQGRLPYVRGAGFQAVAIPYGKGQLTMLVVVPDEMEGLAEVEKSLTSQNVDGWIAQMEYDLVEISLPRLEMRSRIDLKPPLRELGIRRAFEFDKADFSGIHVPAGDDALYIAKALHEAYVKVNEEGTEATAATAVAMSAAGIPAPPPKVRADRPFLFLIRDQLTENILFIGRVVDPESK